jgi:cytochrome c peroxidase
MGFNARTLFSSRKHMLGDLRVALPKPTKHQNYNLTALAAFLMATGLTIRIPNAQASDNNPGMTQIAHSAASAPELLQIILGATPSSISATLSFLDGSGTIGSYLPGGAVATAGNPFFDTTLTSNGRNCFTCHVPQSGWAISPPQIATIYASTAGKSPLFQPIDAANCPDAPGATGRAGSKFVAARTELFNRGDFRISINGPNLLGPNDASFHTFNGNITPDWVLTVKSDPTGCEKDKTYGLPANLVSVYRRAMPTANIAFLDPGATGPGFNIMWDAREPSLEAQFVDATEFHGQTTVPPSLAQQTEAAEFQSGVFASQTADFTAGDLTGRDGSGAMGGPLNLFDSRMNVPAAFPFTPRFCFDGGTGFCPGIFGIPTAFDFYTAFANTSGKVPPIVSRRQSIARGEVIFNTRSFIVNDVVGLNNVKGACSTVPGAPNECTATCST